MAAVLLTVLKITGISLLAITGLVLLILLALLFVPVGYRANGNYFSRSDYRADIRAAWLLHTVSLIVDYCSGQARHVRIKLFGITVYDNFKTGKRKARNKKRKRTKTKQKDTGKIQAAASDADNLETGSKLTGDNYEKPEECVNEYPNVIEARAEKTKPNIFRKIRDFFTKIVEVFKNIKFTFKKICGTIVRIRDNIKYYLKVWRRDSTKKALALCRKQLGRVWREIRPRKFRLDFHLGFDDPALTGEALAVWGMLYPVHMGTVNINPEFDRNVLEGSFAMKGRFRMYVLAMAAFILYRDKNLKKLVRQVRREAA